MSPIPGQPPCTGAPGNPQGNLTDREHRIHEEAESQASSPERPPAGMVVVLLRSQSAWPSPPRRKRRRSGRKMLRHHLREAPGGRRPRVLSSPGWPGCPTTVRYASTHTPNILHVRLRALTSFCSRRVPNTSFSNAVSPPRPTHVRNTSARQSVAWWLNSHGLLSS